MSKKKKNEDFGHFHISISIPFLYLLHKTLSKGSLIDAGLSSKFYLSYRDLSMLALRSQFSIKQKSLQFDCILLY